MARKKSKKKFHLNLGVVLRLIIFGVAIYFAIKYLSTSAPISSTNPPDPTVLGDETTTPDMKPYLNQAYQLIPIKSRGQLENLDKSPVIISLQKKIQEIQSQSQDFPQRQIKEIQKFIIKTVSDDLIKKVDSSK